MSSHKNRLAKLEAGTAAGVQKYCCIYHEDQQPELYRVTPITADKQPAGPAFTLTAQEFETFRYRPDVDLIIIIVRHDEGIRPR